MKITKITAQAVPLKPSGKKVSLTETARPEVSQAICVEIHAGSKHTGIGFATTVGAADAIVSLIRSDFTPLLLGENPLAIEKLASLIRSRTRSIGFAGLVARAYAPIDIALWDLKAKAAGLSLAQLLGGVRESAPAFLGDAAPLGSDSASTVKTAGPSLANGILGVSVDVGSGDMQLDADRVQQIRDGLGESAWIGIHADGRYDIGTALAMGHFYEEDVGIDWIESPLANEDHVGYQRLAERMEVPIAIGASFDSLEEFRQLIERKTARVLRPNPYRLGGITPILKLAAIAETFQMVVVPSRCPEIAVHLACGLPSVPMVELGGWLGSCFEQATHLSHGKIAPPKGHGLGLDFKADLLPTNDA